MKIRPLGFRRTARTAHHGRGLVAPVNSRPAGLDRGAAVARVPPVHPDCDEAQRLRAIRADLEMGGTDEVVDGAAAQSSNSTNLRRLSIVVAGRLDPTPDRREARSPGT